CAYLIIHSFPTLRSSDLRFIYYIPLAFIGFRPLDIMLMYSATQIWGIFIHTKTIKKLPALLEFFLVTPSHHRVHHGSNPLYLDRSEEHTSELQSREKLVC